ncbi:AraC family transcriptional regulator [uncultured Roseobacter sp.]|uniref:AraC family transcriptional regulator n=1 Tax=uncultured Roseobacter sp. TaxID=114847 RepID=UPI002629519A|nr:AraC family transcriptional regulator [uncultured Roseobacter sp.]
MALLDRLVWQIEVHLDETPSLAVLSERCTVSQHHMCRVFRQVTGLSIMSYIRARRLSRAARRIALDDMDILAAALEAGYTSHAAFTRAFAAYFGCAPSIVRQARSLSTLSLMEPLEMKKEMIVDIAEPEMRHRAEFRVVGLSKRCSFESIAEIPGLWQAFNAREDEVENAVPGAAYGVCCDADDNGQFRYLAGMEASGRTHGMDHVDIPAQRYAVFTHRGHVSDLPKTVYTIWNKALPDAGLSPAAAPDFEVYGHRFDVETGRGDVEIWIPVTE